MTHTLRATRAAVVARRRVGHAPRRCYALTANAATKSTVNVDEIAHFSRLSEHWWDETGEFGMLHKLNPVRAKFIRDHILRTIEDEGHPNPGVSRSAFNKPLDGLTAVDVGCGGGLLSETLARMGAETLAIDASASNIKIASAHASQDPFLSPRTPAFGRPLVYRHTTSDILAKEGKVFDVVASMEVVEHVDNPADFVRSCATLVKPGGHLFLSTVARTPLSYFLTIFMAEHALRLVTPGTHTWSKYINADEVHAFFRDDLEWLPQHGAPSDITETRGIFFNPFTFRWSLLPRDIPGALDVNYIFWIRRPFTS